MSLSRGHRRKAKQVMDSANNTPYREEEKPMKRREKDWGLRKNVKTAQIQSALALVKMQHSKTSFDIRLIAKMRSARDLVDSVAKDIEAHYDASDHG